MKALPVQFLFWGAFFGLLTVCGLAHLHGLLGLTLSAAGAAFLVWASRSWWKRGLEPVKCSKASLKDPAFGNRQQRREQEKREVARRKH